MRILDTISKCIELLGIDGENSKAIVREKLIAIRNETCCMCLGDDNGICPGISGIPHPDPTPCTLFDQRRVG